MRRESAHGELAAVARRLAGRHVLVVGDVVADEYVYGRTDRISREAPVLVVRQEATERKLGGAGNAAASIAALGGRAELLGAVGDDAAGRGLRSLCEIAGIDAKLIPVNGSFTETKTRILAGGINTTRQQIVRVDHARDLPLPAEVEAPILARLRKAEGVVVVSDYGGGVLSPRVIEEIRAASGRGVTVCVDSRYNLRAFRGVAVAKPNEPELAAATGLDVGTEEATTRAARLLLKTSGAGAVLVTRGRSGMLLLEKGKRPDPIPVHGKADAVDVTGAGDTVIATLALALAAGADLSQATRLANVAGGLVVMKPGTASVSRAELEAEVER